MTTLARRAPVTIGALIASKRGGLSSEKSRTTFDDNIKRYCRALGYASHEEIPVMEITPDMLKFARAKLEQQVDPPLRPGTIRQTIGAIRQLVEEAYDRGLVEHWQWHALRKVKVKGTRETKGRALSDVELVALLARCATLETPRREMLRAVLLIGIGTGLRVSELCYSPVTKRGLLVDCVAPDGHLHVVGKGNKENVVVLDRVTRLALDAWLEVRRALPWRHLSLFGTPRRGRHLRPDCLWKLFRTLAKGAGVRAFSPHDLRRTFASRMLDQMGLEEVAKLMAHVSMETTRRYDKRLHAELVAKRRAATVFDPEVVG
jgi:integrase